MPLAHITRHRTAKGQPFLRVHDEDGSTFEVYLSYGHSLLMSYNRNPETIPDYLADAINREARAYWQTVYNREGTLAGAREKRNNRDYEGKGHTPPRGHVGGFGLTAAGWSAVDKT